jgi:hypothetical protein
MECNLSLLHSEIGPLLYSSISNISLVASKISVPTELSLEVAGSPPHQLWRTVKLVGNLGSGDKNIVSHGQPPLEDRRKPGSRGNPRRNIFVARVR